MDNGPDGKFSPRSWSLHTLKHIVDKWQTCMYEHDGWNALFLENHDQSRSVSRFTPHKSAHRTFAAKALATFIGFQSGTLFIYQGQELGMANLPKNWSIEDYKDVETQNYYQMYVFSGKDPHLSQVRPLLLRLCKQGLSEVRGRRGRDGTVSRRGPSESKRSCPLPCPGQ